MNELQVQKPSIDKSSVPAVDGVQTSPMTSGATVLLEDIGDNKTEVLQAEPDDKADTLTALSKLVDQDNRVEKVDLAWDGDGCKFSVQGPVTRLGLTLGSMVAVLGIVVFNEHPVTDAYVPMAGVGSAALISSYLERRK